MKCVDDGNDHSPLSPNIIAERAAELCLVAEEEIKKGNKIELPVYVIGTDVPPPGGSKEEVSSMHITTPEEVEETINLSRRSFLNYGLEDAWNRVVAVVVQPGVEFGDKKIFDYNRNQAIKLLTKKIETKTDLVYEAHSTDFQLKESLKQMVEDHFAILKVGPWLTYAFREAVFALEMIEKELISARKHITLSELSKILEFSMLKNSVYWRKYYTGLNDEELRFRRRFSLSDRVRYYWNENHVRESLGRLFFNLSKRKIPITLISQFLPESYESVRNGEIENIPEALIINRILKVLEKYNYATIKTKE